MDRAAPPTAPHPPAAGPPRPRAPGEPYCSNCGYSLAGATETARCPECGLPIVEVLTRTPRLHAVRRYRSEATLFGLPILEIALGPDPDKGEMRGKARAIIAIGDVAFGGIAMGGMSVGVVSFGGMSVGVFSAGGMSVGLLAAAGGMAVGTGLSVGGGAIGALAVGGGAVGFAAAGGGAVGYYATGGGAFGRHVIMPGRNDPQAAAGFRQMEWFFGRPMPGAFPVQPFAVTLAAIVVPALVIGFAALWGHRRHESGRREQALRTGARR